MKFSRKSMRAVTINYDKLTGYAIYFFSEHSKQAYQNVLPSCLTLAAVYQSSTFPSFPMSGSKPNYDMSSPVIRELVPLLENPEVLDIPYSIL